MLMLYKLGNKIIKLNTYKLSNKETFLLFLFIFFVLLIINYVMNCINNKYEIKLLFV